MKTEKWVRVYFECKNIFCEKESIIVEIKIEENWNKDLRYPICSKCKEEMYLKGGLCYQEFEK